MSREWGSAEGQDASRQVACKRAAAPAHDAADGEGREAARSRLLEQHGEHAQHACTLRANAQAMLRQHAQVVLWVQGCYVRTRRFICSTKSISSEICGRQPTCTCLAGAGMQSKSALRLMQDFRLVELFSTCHYPASAKALSDERVCHVARDPQAAYELRALTKGGPGLWPVKPLKGDVLEGVWQHIAMVNGHQLISSRGSPLHQDVACMPIRQTT